MIPAQEPIREVQIHAEEFASRFSIMRIMARIKAATVLA
jgi:hypothetical protein